MVRAITLHPHLHPLSLSDKVSRGSLTTGSFFVIWLIALGRIQSMVIFYKPSRGEPVTFVYLFKYVIGTPTPGITYLLTYIKLDRYFGNSKYQNFRNTTYIYNVPHFGLIEHKTITRFKTMITDWKYRPLHVTCKLCTSRASPHISANIDH